MEKHLSLNILWSIELRLVWWRIYCVIYNRNDFALFLHIFVFWNVVVPKNLLLHLHVLYCIFLASCIFTFYHYYFSLINFWVPYFTVPLFSIVPIYTLLITLLPPSTRFILCFALCTADNNDIFWLFSLKEKNPWTNGWNLKPSQTVRNRTDGTRSAVLENLQALTVYWFRMITRNEAGLSIPGNSSSSVSTG